MVQQCDKMESEEYAIKLSKSYRPADMRSFPKGTITIGNTTSFWKRELTAVRGKDLSNIHMVTPDTTAASDEAVMDYYCEEAVRINPRVASDKDSFGVYCESYEIIMWIVGDDGIFLGKVDFRPVPNALSAMYVCANPHWKLNADIPQVRYARSYCIWAHFAAWALRANSEYLTIDEVTLHIVPIIEGIGFRPRAICCAESGLCGRLQHYGESHYGVCIDTPVLVLENAKTIPSFIYTAKTQEVYDACIEVASLTWEWKK